MGDLRQETGDWRHERMKIINKTFPEVEVPAKEQAFLKSHVSRLATIHVILADRPFLAK